MIPYISLSEEKIDSFLDNVSKAVTASFASVNIVKVEEQFELLGEEAVLNYFLTELEKKKFDSFRFEKRKMEWLAGRIAAKKAAIKMFSQSQIKEKSTEKGEWKKWELRGDKNGRPFFVSRKGNPDISISHSGLFAISMVAQEKTCGIDIQKISPRILKVEKKFVDPKEKCFKNCQGLEHFSDEKFLTLIWSAKEALRKGSGHKPVAGFMEMKLHFVTEKKGNSYVFQFTCTRDTEKGKKEKFFKTCQTVIDGYAISFTI